MISVFDLPLPDDILKWQQGTAGFDSYTDRPSSLSQWLSIVFQCHDEFCYLAVLRGSGIWKLLGTGSCSVGALLLSSFFV